MRAFVDADGEHNAVLLCIFLGLDGEGEEGEGALIVVHSSALRTIQRTAKPRRRFLLGLNDYRFSHKLIQINVWNIVKW